MRRNTNQPFCHSTPCAKEPSGKLTDLTLLDCSARVFRGPGRVIVGAMACLFRSLQSRVRALLMVHSWHTRHRKDTVIHNGRQQVQSAKLLETLLLFVTSYRQGGLLAFWPVIGGCYEDPRKWLESCIKWLNGYLGPRR
jgi:hypothetical protein